MANFAAEYSSMEALSHKLHSAQSDIQGQLNALQGDVENLTSGDFKTEVASGKFNDGYQQLTKGLNQALDGIGEMGQQLTTMMQKIQQLDHELAGN